MIDEKIIRALIFVLTSEVNTGGPAANVDWKEVKALLRLLIKA